MQAMILIDFLLSLTSGAKDKWKDIKTPNRSVQYAHFTLSPEDVNSLDLNPSTSNSGIMPALGPRNWS